MKKVVLGPIPSGFDLYTSWIGLQQSRPDLRVAAFFENAGKVLLCEDGDELSLPTIFHSASDPGLLNALQRLLKSMQSSAVPRGVKLLGVCEQEDGGSRSPWYVLVKVPMQGLTVPRGFVWVDPNVVTEGRKLADLVLASMSAFMALSTSVVPTSVPETVVVPVPEPAKTVKSRRRKTAPTLAVGH